MKKNPKYFLFRVENEEHSKKIQTRLFELGWTWPNHGQDLRQIDKPLLWMHFFSVIGDEKVKDIIRWGVNFDTIIEPKDEAQELTLEDLYDDDCPLVPEGMGKTKESKFSIAIFPELQSQLDKFIQTHS